MPLGIRSIEYDAEGGQQDRGQDDQAEVGPGEGDQVDPPPEGTRCSVSGSR